jgi:uncharacterized coiled-coil protein SlyX
VTSLGRYAAQLRSLTDEFLALPDSQRDSVRYALAVAEVARLMELEEKLAEQW